MTTKPQPAAVAAAATPADVPGPAPSGQPAGHEPAAEPGHPYPSATPERGLIRRVLTELAEWRQKSTEALNEGPQPATPAVPHWPGTHAFIAEWEAANTARAAEDQRLVDSWYQSARQSTFGPLNAWLADRTPPHARAAA